MDGCDEHLDVLTVTTTVGSEEDGQRLAREIIQRRLAACVQLEARMQSFYRWKGEQCEEAEFRLVIKTLAHCTGPLQALFAQQHPYEVPQFLAWRTQASPAYAAWVRGEISAPEGD